MIISSLLVFQPVFPASLKCGKFLGFSKILGENIENAYSQSKSVALRNAVETSVGLFVSSRSVINNFSQIQDKIFTFSEGFIENYSIISQSIVDSSTVKTELHACVSLDPLNSELQNIRLLSDEVGSPRIGILFNRKICRSDPGLYSNLISLLKEAGIPNSLTKISKPKEYVDFNQFDIIIEISVEIEDLGNTPIPHSQKSLEDIDFNSVYIYLGFEGYWTDTLEIITQRNFSRTLLSKSLCSALSTLFSNEENSFTEKIVTDLIEHWNEGFQNGRHVLLKANMSAKTSIQFKKILEKILVVNDPVKSYRYANGSAEFDLRTNYSGRELAKLLVTIAETRNDTLEFDKITFNTVSLTWTPHKK